MSVATKARELGRAVLRSTPESLKRRVPVSLRRRIGRFLVPESARAPLLSVVVPVYNVEAYLAECLSSVLSQSLTNLEVLVVDDGSTDRSPEIIAEFARSDPRIRTFRQANAGQGPARNLAVSHARGQFLAFLDADDVIPPGSYRYLVRSMQRSGSDFSVGSIRRITNGRLSEASWTAVAHRRDRIGITIDDFPAALLDVIACNRMFRLDFWHDYVGGFPGGMVYEDHVPMVKAYLRARSFDLLAKVTYHWRIRENQTSTGQQKHVLTNLSDRVQVKAEAYEVLKREASNKVVAAWIGRVLDTDFPPFIEHALVADAKYRAVLQSTFAQYRAIAEADALSHVRVKQKILGYLVSRGEWDQVELVRRYFAEHGSPPPTVLDGRRVLADFALTPLAALNLPESVRELGGRETALRTCLSGAVWSDPGQLLLTGWSFIPAVDLCDRTPEISAWLENLTTRARRPLEVLSRPTSEATRWSRQSNANCDRAGFELSIDARQLATTQPADSTWQLRLRVRLDGLVRGGSVHRLLSGSSAASNSLAAYTLDERGNQVVPRLDSAAGFILAIEQPPMLATSLDPPDERRAAGTVASARPGDLVPVSVRAVERSSRQILDADLRSATGGSHRFDMELPTLTDEHGHARTAEWDVKIVDDAGRIRPVGWPAAMEKTRLAAPGADFYWQRLNDGLVRLVADRLDVSVAALDVTDDELAVTLTGDRVADATVTLANGQAKFPPRMTARRADQLIVRFPMSAAFFDWPTRPLPSGTYWFMVSDSAGPAYHLSMSPDLVGQMPTEFVTASHHVRFTCSTQAALQMKVEAPLNSRERSDWGQARLRETYRASMPALEESVLFQCHSGESATDCQLAIHRGLREAAGDITLYWCVRDQSVHVPEGAVRVIVGSEQWYEKLASARYLCHNGDFGLGFHKKPGQRYLQTFDGHPFQAIGRRSWHAERYSPQRIAYECQRRNAAWDAIVAPNQLSADLYRDEYDYGGEVLVTGCPRTDALVNPDPAVRDLLRTTLGIRPEQTVVLYAPTSRQTATARTPAEVVAGLDLSHLVDQLGDSYVVLVRHPDADHSERVRIGRTERTHDVSEYPEINHLILASDVALLDYSSLRFDWALTGKPSLFFVPDLDSRLLDRPPLFEFHSSAPGPLLRSIEEVDDALQRIGQVAVEYGPAMQSFNATFNALNDGHATSRVVEAFFSLPW